METKERPAPGMTSNRFLSVLGQTPALLSACTQQRNSTHQARQRQNSKNLSPLKTLRLVCRGGRIEASRAVTEFELTLSREPSRDMSGMAQLLDGACLKTLCVGVVDKVLLRGDGKRAILHDGE